jgi:hypothetical protein
MNLRAHGVAVDLPPGWEGSIAGNGAKTDGDDATTPVVHLCTAALPPGRGDFGSGAVEGLGDDDAFVALVEYGADCAGTAVFAAQGLPRRLRTRAFNRRALQRTIDGQCGLQVFFTEAGRPFCLYVVLGRDHDTAPLLDRVHAALDSIRIEA